MDNAQFSKFLVGLWIFANDNRTTLRKCNRSMFFQTCLLRTKGLSDLESIAVTFLAPHSRAYVPLYADKIFQVQQSKQTQQSIPSRQSDIC